MRGGSRKPQVLACQGRPVCTGRTTDAWNFHVRAFGLEQARMNFLPEAERRQALFVMRDFARAKGVAGMESLKSLGGAVLNRVSSVAQKASETAGSLTQFVKDKAKQVLGEHKPAPAADLKERGSGALSLANTTTMRKAMELTTTPWCT